MLFPLKKLISDLMHIYGNFFLKSSPMSNMSACNLIVLFYISCTPCILELYDLITVSHGTVMIVLVKISEIR